MKVSIIQPEYSADFARSDELFAKQIELLESCTQDCDIIVMPESCDVPCFAGSKENAKKSSDKFNRILLQKAAETARRCDSIVFVNANYTAETGRRNTTYAINRQGEIVGHYYKKHLTPGERLYKDNSYAMTFDSPTVIEIEGLRFGFLTCYDFYFYESFARMAREKLDIIIGCSHQRTDTHAALEMMTRFCAYNTNAYVLRSSVSMGADEKTGGGSMVVSPDGTVLLNMESRIGVESAELDPFKKYYKPAGFRNPDSAHYEYIEKGRRPWQYRPGGSAIVPNDAEMPYPRICAHRGFNTVAPENSMPAFGAAVALGAEEIEFDLWITKDGEIVSAHDESLDRVSDGTGKIRDYTYEELLAFDFGVKHSEYFKGLQIPKFEDILKKFACHTVMNVHIKPNSLSEDALAKIVALIDKYDCADYIYFMSGSVSVLELLQKSAPHIERCAGAGGRDMDLVDKALATGCGKIQLFKPDFEFYGPDYLPDIISRAHANGIICNIFWSDDPAETAEYFAMGIETVLTNDYQRNAAVLNNFSGTQQ